MNHRHARHPARSSPTGSAIQIRDFVQSWNYKPYISMVQSTSHHLCADYIHRTWSTSVLPYIFSVQRLRSTLKYLCEYAVPVPGLTNFKFFLLFFAECTLVMFSSQFIDHHFCTFAVLRLLLVVLATTATAKPTYPETSASEGHCHYDKFRDCVCGQEYAYVENKKDIPNYDLKNYYVHMTNKGKERYYYCRPCSICEDGRETIATCYENRDTLCSKCIHPLVYDEWTRSCQPVNMNIEKTPDVIEPYQNRDNMENIRSHDNIITKPQITIKPTLNVVVPINDIGGNIYDNAKGEDPLKGEPYVSDTLMSDGEKSSGLNGFLISVICVSAVIILLAVIFMVYLRLGNLCTTRTEVARSDVIRHKDDPISHDDETKV
ncbi:uncharacterized protein LOC100374589 [Saccoglossus kowalevskii]|uniref:Uncharacterized protein LOC100374589 n=1 Tax=Saccoglossus kowalevskii TaxID=10224 RepID=A0ABM0GW36_SACKO|nr:PREDICTED: uncharacterized protein LOC100374589 [Saccoglossus kowalevskii]